MGSSLGFSFPVLHHFLRLAFLDASLRQGFRGSSYIKGELSGETEGGRKDGTEGRGRNKARTQCHIKSSLDLTTVGSGDELQCKVVLTFRCPDGCVIGYGLLQDGACVTTRTTQFPSNEYNSLKKGSICEFSAAYTQQLGRRCPSMMVSRHQEDLLHLASPQLDLSDSPSWILPLQCPLLDPKPAASEVKCAIPFCLLHQCWTQYVLS